jgi:hypothetical protein
MKPPSPEEAPSTSIFSLFADDARSASLVMLSTGLCRVPSFKISLALVASFDVDRRSFESLFSSRYRSSLAGNECERGSAIASCARMARKVTRSNVMMVRASPACHVPT